MSKNRISIEELYRRDRGICGVCLEPVRMADATREHIIPRSEGGTDSPSNITLAHDECNEWRMTKQLRLKPVVMSYLDPMDIEDYQHNLIPAWALRKRMNVPQ